MLDSQHDEVFEYDALVGDGESSRMSASKYLICSVDSVNWFQEWKQ